MGQDGCERRIEIFVKIQKKKIGGGGGVRGVGLGGGQGGCERRIEVFVKIQKKIFFFFFFFFLGGGGGGVGGWGLDRGSGWGGVRVDVNEVLKFLGKFTKKKFGGGGVR